MNEYQIAVARGGQFLFRTDWDHRQERVQSAVDVLQATGLQVAVYARAQLIQRVTTQFTGAVTC